MEEKWNLKITETYYIGYFAGRGWFDLSLDHINKKLVEYLNINKIGPAQFFATEKKIKEKLKEN